jgi:xanthine dehydrogenase YagR molybdenum-binding subunit
MDDPSRQGRAGVLAIVTAENAGKLGKGNFNTARLLGGPEIEHYHQAIAVVVAETFEQARAAAALIKVDYTRAKGSFDLAAAKDAAVKPKEGQPRHRRRRLRRRLRRRAGQAGRDLHHARPRPRDDGAARLDRRLDRRQADRLDLQPDDRLGRATSPRPWDPQGECPPDVALYRRRLRRQARCAADAILAALGAAAAGRPVKVALPRPLMFNNTTHRPATIQRIRIGATQDGKITAIGHESWSGDLPGGGPETAASRPACSTPANRMTQDAPGGAGPARRQRHARARRGAGLMALEIAMDEMAEKLNMDPVEFRMINDTQVDPEKPGAAVLAAQADRMPAHRGRAFGWASASAAPVSPRRPLAGRHGRGRGVPQQPDHEVRRPRAARRTGVVTVETDMTDIGTGSYTIIAQTAAEMMGVPLDKVVVRLGDSSFPGLGRLGRPVGRQQLDGRRLRRLRQAARGRGHSGWAWTRRRRCSDGQVKRGQPEPSAGQAAADGRPRRRGLHGVRRSRQDPRSSRPSAPTSSRSAVDASPARSASAACWRSAPPAASSIPSRPAAR